ncbi:hypothetical protein [Hyphococcus sp.]|uniref:hypothetical protein n=1 Tax=Hyphococcus sp. TaxID=2038636 RepID=UPI0035C694A3
MTQSGKLKAPLWVCAVIWGAHMFSGGGAQAKDCTNDAGGVKHYRRLAEISSIAEPIIGVFEVAPKKAKAIAHFRILYDGCEQIKEIQYYHGGTPKPIDENFASNRFLPASKVIFDRDGGRARIRYYDNAGNPKSVFENVRSVMLVHDEAGKLSSAEFLDENDELVFGGLGYARAEWIWRDNGSAIETHYDAAGNIVESSGEFPFREAQLDFGPDGFVKTINPEGLSYHIEIARNEDRTRRFWRIVNADHSPGRGGAAGVSRIDYSYDENGYLIRAKYLDENGEPLVALSGHMGFRRVYNEAGNRLAYHFLNENDEVWIPPDRGYAGQIFRWRQDGVVRMSTSYVNASEQVMAHPGRGYATIVYDFDEYDLEIRRRFLDVAGDPVEATQ